MTHCPNCRARVESTAVVAAFNDPPGWAFWGVEGCRWIVCRAAGYVHFRACIEGRMYHRLAQIATAPLSMPAPAPAQPAAVVVEREEWLP